MKTSFAVLTLFLTAAVWANSAFAVVDFETKIVHDYGVTEMLCDVIKRYGHIA